jgi:TPR repeat protein
MPYASSMRRVVWMAAVHLVLTSCADIRTSVTNASASMERSFASFDADLRTALGLDGTGGKESALGEKPVLVPSPKIRYREAMRVLASDAPDVDRSRAISELREAAEAGFDEAQYRLAELYWMTAETGDDRSHALSWFEKAARQGHGQAAFRLGDATLNGSGIPANGARAVTWFRQAADRDVAAAQYMLGMLHVSGRHVRKDQAEAERWFSRAAANGHVEAAVYLAALRRKSS